MENQKNILDYDTVALDEAQDAVIIIDQTLLPGKIELIALHTTQEASCPGFGTTRMTSAMPTRPSV